MKYKEWLKIWLENYVKPTAKKRTFERYFQIVNLRITQRLGDYEPDQITSLELQKFVTELMERGNLLTGKGLSVNSVNGIITVVQNSLKLAYILGEVKEYVGDKIKRPKPKEKEISCFSHAEQKKIEQAVFDDKRNKMFGIVLCLYSGVRIGELLALTWKNVDLYKGTLAIKRTCYDGKDERGKSCREEDEPKTLSSKRIIPIPKQILKMLKERCKDSASEYVISCHGKPVSVRSYQRSFELLLKRLSIERKGFHSLRHTFATRALECGMDVKMLSEILGHKNPTITLNRYAHSMIEYKKELMNKLGKNLE